MPAAYSYIRFSTPEQALGDSKRRQVRLAEEYCARHPGLKLNTELTYEDLGVSAYRGANAETGMLAAFRVAVEQGDVAKGSYLLVESLDRVSRRSVNKAVQILQELVELGITVVTLNDGKKYTEESLEGFDFLIAVVILIRANEESKTKADRLKAAWQSKRKDARETGKLLTSLMPGWITKGSDGRPQLDPVRAQVVRRIVREFLGGKGKPSIATGLNADRVPTFGRSTYWLHSYIHKVLASPALIGTMVPHVDIQKKDDKKAGATKTVREAQPPILNYLHIPAKAGQCSEASKAIIPMDAGPVWKRSGELSSL